MDAYERRIHAVLGNDNARTERNAERYRQHLIKHLSLPLVVTGTDDFPWEEPYIFGGWDKREYEKLKKTNPSHTDTFELQSLEPPDEHEEVVAKVKRVSDGRVFHLGLSSLCCEDEEGESSTLLEDYGVWHAHY